MGIGLLVDEAELRKFIEWLPDIEWNEAYVVMILIRSKLLKKEFGFKGTDHTLKLEIVPGYLVRWRERLLRKIKQFAVLGYYSEELYEYIRYKPGTREPEEILNIPNKLIGIMVSVNSADWVKASVKAVEEFNMSLWEAMRNPEKADRLVRRIDLRIPALCMKYAKHRFWQIDVDTKNTEAIWELEILLRKTIGYVPARIETPHGYHYLVPIYRLEEARAGAFAMIFKNEVYGVKAVRSLEKLINKTEDEELRSILRKAVETRYSPFYVWKCEWANKLAMDIDKIAETKNDFQEPAPGTIYQGKYIVRFRKEVYRE